MTLSHADRVGAVARDLTARPPGTRITIRKATPTHSIRDASYKKDCYALDVSGIGTILSIDVPQRRARPALS